MINSIKGILTEISPTNITIDASGIGYEILIPLSSFDKLPKVGSECKILIYMHVREDILQLFGFITHEEKDLFKMLIAISGIGPKTALTILSGMTIDNLKNAIASENTEMLNEIPGIGKKTAQRIIIELKEKIGKPGIKTTKPLLKDDEIILNDVVSALVNLGYKQSSAQTAVEKALEQEQGEIKLEDLIKKALKYL
jgi:Holliday junction DNA helicase RuvA